MTGEHQVRASYINVPFNGHNEKIHTLTAGPQPSLHKPAVIFVSGLGTPCLGFATVMRQLANAGIRSYAHDRSGIGRSPGTRLQDRPAEIQKGKPEGLRLSSIPGRLPEESRSAIQMADHLAAFLEAAKIPPPYVLALHSYGGIIGREYLAKHVSDVLGAVLVDTNCENAVDRSIRIPELEQFIATKGINFWDDSGLTAQNQLEAQELAELAQQGDLPPGFERGSGGGKVESVSYNQSVRGLKRLRQYEEHVLGRKPISVVKGTVDAAVLRLLDCADEREVGSKELRDRIRRQMTGFNDNEVKLQRAQLQLSEEGCGRMVDVKDAGHYVHVSHPQIVTKEIEWVFEQVNERGLIQEWEASQKKA